MKWVENEGVELFDILGEEKLREKVRKRVKYLPGRYDKSFYGDQKSARKAKIVNRINEDYVEQKKEEEAVRSRKRRRVELAYGISTSSSGETSSVQIQEGYSTEEEGLCDDPITEAPIDMNISGEICYKSVETRNETLLNIP